MKNLVVGILAHVDAGKTTLCESLLYVSGKIAKLGRVDKQNAYLDTELLEKERGITIFSKQAVFSMNDKKITLLDTPGHVDFSAEMERTLQVLDYAILVISAADGVQEHTKTLWKLLDFYQIPRFLFINKMDQQGADKDKIMKILQSQLEERCVDFSFQDSSFYEEISLCDEALMEEFLLTNLIQQDKIQAAILQQKIYPCYFGSALKIQGVEEFIQGFSDYTFPQTYPQKFGAKIFKITRDEQGSRLTHMKVTGGELKVRDVVKTCRAEEKVNQIRIYSGAKFETVSQVQAGEICAVTGLSFTRPGDTIGIELAHRKPILEPVLSYRMMLPEKCDPREWIPKLRQIEEEHPELNIVWDEQLGEIQVALMGEVQIEILQKMIQNCFGIEVSFGEGKIVYKETIAEPVEGVGHFEPLRHYAEVHLLLEPLKRGSGLQFDTDCSEDVLAKNWQRLVLTHLKEKTHKGVLTGAPITDMRITLLTGRAHNKHTEGGDFREATYRAVRQGLKQAKSILLEPYYDFTLELPDTMVGRALTDIEKKNGMCEISQNKEGVAVIKGYAPVVTMRNYQREVTAYTKGNGRLSFQLRGYETCHNAEEVTAAIGYDSERDLANPTGSVFCSHGTGFVVSWDKVKDYMHLESAFRQDTKIQNDVHFKTQNNDKWMSLEEIDEILSRIAYSNQGKKSDWKKKKTARQSYYEKVSAVSVEPKNREEYLLVDGYNIIHAWEELKQLADDDNMDGARMKLLEKMSNYQSIKGNRVIVVFDAYRVKGHQEEVIDYHNIRVVFTKEIQTADQYIERFAHDHQKEYKITVATSDGLQQVITRGAGCFLLSARELELEMKELNERIQEEYQKRQKNYQNLMHLLPPETKLALEKLTSQIEEK